LSDCHGNQEKALGINEKEMREEGMRENVEITLEIRRGRWE